MRILLDTHLLIWVFDKPERLSTTAVAIIEDDRNELCFSPISILETAIKSALGKRDFLVDAIDLRRSLLENNYFEVAFTGSHALGVCDLPSIHKDPFDRILIAQATVEHMTLLTADKTIARYPGPIRTV